MNAVARKVKAHLKREGISQNQFAREMGVSHGYMSELMHGTKRPGLRLALRMEQATGIPVREFAGAA